MLDRRTIFEVHRLRNEGWSKKKIAATLHLSAKTVRKYLQNPNPERIPIHRASKLDPFREEIQRLLNFDPTASSAVIRQRIAPQGFDGGLTILKDYLHRIRGPGQKKQAFIRFESLPGEHYGKNAIMLRRNQKAYFFLLPIWNSRLGYFP